MARGDREMNPMAAVWNQAASTVRRAFVPLALYDLLFKVFALVVMTPPTAMALEKLVATSGSLSVTNADIAGFLFSPWGLLFLFLASTFSLTSLFAEEAGLIHIAAQARSGERESWLNALRLTISALPRLLSVAAAQVGILLLWLLPLAAIAGGTYLALLTSHDINWYLTARPPEFWIAVAIGALLALAALGIVSVLLVRWALAVPLCLYQGLTYSSALTRSRELLRSHNTRAALLVMGWITAAILVSLVTLLVLDQGIGLLLTLFADVSTLIVLTALSIGVLTIAGAVLSFVAFAGYSFIVIHLYEELGDRFPDAKTTASASAREGRLGKLAVVIFLLVAAGISFTIVGKATDDLSIGRDVHVTAHRGSSLTAPENSLSAIRQAIDDGADYAEIDVQETADGMLVLLHDTDLMRVAGVNAKIWEVEYGEIRDLDAGSWFSPKYAGERIPTLQQAMDLARGHLRLNIELKYNGHDVRLAERTAELVRESGFVEECVITSLDSTGLQRVREVAPDIEIGQIVTVSIGDFVKLDVDFLSINANVATPAQVRRNRAEGLDTHVWTVNDKSSMARMIERGVNNIITDEPALLRRVIDERAELSDGELLLLALSAHLRDDIDETP
jgi:glycerophosphoryl diester phosphodiesterase